MIDTVAAVMIERELLRVQLIQHEGLRLFPYVDTVGKMTIGVGRNLSENGVSRVEAMLMLEHDIDGVVTDLTNFSWFVMLDPVRQRVVADMRFNLGPTKFRTFVLMIKALADGKYLLAAHQMRQSKWATQVGARAERLALMMETGA